jgi:hypothetical protein
MAFVRNVEVLLVFLNPELSSKYYVVRYWAKVVRSKSYIIIVKNGTEIVFYLGAIVAFSVYLGKELRFQYIFYHTYKEMIHRYWCSLNLGDSRQEIANIHLFLKNHNK